jgi:hypothetical protein
MATATSDPTAVIAEGETPPSPPPLPEAPVPTSGSGWEIRFRNGDLVADITGIAMNKSVTRRLNRPAFASFRVPSYLVSEVQIDGRPLLCSGYRTLSVTFPETGLFFHGIIWNIEEDGDEDMVYSQVTAFDPMMLWRYRPARDDVDSYSGDAGNFSDPSFLDRNKFGGSIMLEILTASEGLTDLGRIPEFAEGPLFLDLAVSTFEAGGADLSGAPTNWPMTIAEIATLLTNTGELDIYIEPLLEINPTDNANLGIVHTYTGDFGTDRTATVHFDYATGDFNARLYRRSEDMSTVNNKIFYFLGPRLDQQHWRSNVTRDHPGLSGFPSFPALYTEIDVSRNFLGVMMQIGIFDNFGTGSGGSESSAYPLFLRQWMVESLLRLYPRNMVYITPVRYPALLPGGGDVFTVGDFDIGDLVTINIGDKARIAESGVQRIYQYTIEVDDDGVAAIGEFQSSPDQDSI